MATGDATAVLNSIVSIWSAIRELLDTGYRVSEKLKGSEQKLKQLGREQEFWESQIVKFDLSWDRDLLEIFLDAKSQLEHEKEGLTTKFKSRRWPKLKRAVFPSQVEEIILRVDKIFENALQELQRRTVITGELQKRALFKVPLLSFKEDNRYVRLENTNKEVIGALGHADGPPIVLVHGFSATEKSSLARDVALQVQEAISRRHSEHAGPSQDRGSVGVSNLFEQVIFLECGPRVDLRTKQKELRDALGWNPVSSEGRGAESESDKTLITVLAGLLKEKPVLIILDDLWKSTIDNPEGQGQRSQFLQKMTDVGGKNVKWLVTSQEKDLCSALNCKCKAIPMEHIEPEVARQILARQIGFPMDEIPEAAKMYMDKIIQKVDANPLAMTCICPAIDPKRFGDEREWEKAMEELADLLGTKAATPIQSKEYGLSFWEAIKVGFDLLTKQHQNLLILMALCKGPSVPEEIIEYLFVQSKDIHSYQNFSSARRDLEGRQLITISVSKDRTGNEGRRWALHDLIKEFIMDYFLSKDTKKPLIQTLSNQGIKFESVQEFEIVSTLTALYFSDRFQNEFEQSSSLKRNDPAVTWRGITIEPISRLLVLRESNKWSSILHLSTRQVFLIFVRDGCFNEESILKLLDSDQYAPRAIAALREFSPPVAYSLLGEKVICALVRLLEDATALDVNRQQRLDYDLLTGLSWAVRCVLGYSGTSLGRVSFSKAFAQLANLFMNTTDDHSRTQQRVAGVIVALAGSHEMVDIAGLFDDLVKASFVDDNRDLQAAAFAALKSLALVNHTVAQRLADKSGMLDRLVKALTTDDHHELQNEASQLLVWLSWDDYAASKIVVCPGAVDELVNGLGKDTNKRYQQNCAEALGKLASCGSNVKLKLLQFPAVLDELVKASFKDDDHHCQAAAVNALRYLARGNASVQSRLVGVPGMLDVLVKALGVRDHPSLQWEASDLLISLSNNSYTAEKVADAALEELMNGLGKGKDGNGQFHCAEVLRHLAHVDNVKVRLLQFMEGMVEDISNNHNGHVQATAVNALATLARNSDGFRLQIVNVPGVLNKLMKALTADDHNHLQSEASRLFGSLSSSGHAALKILECPGALDELVNGMFKDANKSHQMHCAEALGNLASCGGNVKLRLLHTPKVTEGLVKAFFKDNLDLRAAAIATLRSLAFGNDSVQLRLVDEPGMLDGLVKELTRARSSDRSWNLEHATFALLGNLSRNNHIALKVADAALEELVNGLAQGVM